jgi:signal transduction histidine kinase
VDQTIGSIITKLRDFYDADTCILINTSPVANEYVLRRVDRRHPELANQTEAVGLEGEQLLLSWPAEWAVIFRKDSNRLWARRNSCSIYNFLSGECLKAGDEKCAWVADLLETNSFVSIPVYQRKTFTARLYLTSKQGSFTYSDVDFLRQVIEHVMPMIDNVRLVDRFASEASEYERQRISRDIHDSAIQPYIGLKLGLEALRKQVRDNDPISAGLAELADKTNSVIKDLRTYVGELQDRGPSDSVNALVSSVQRHATKFGELYDIEVEVKAPSAININDRLAAEVFQIVQEGLSNIKRHTASSSAIISMMSRNGDMILDIENESLPGGETFTPRSITDRAVALGGRVSVTANSNGRTIVSVIIPM